MRLFLPSEIHYGMPITLIVEESDGVLVPVVTVREIDKEATSEVSAEFDRITDALEEALPSV